MIFDSLRDLVTRSLGDHDDRWDDEWDDHGPDDFELPEPYPPETYPRPQ